MKTKYEMTDETIEFEGRTLHKVRGTDERGKVRNCGFVEQELNMPGTDEVRFNWNAKILDCGQVNCRASINDNAIIRDNAIVTGEAKVFGNAEIRECSVVREWALVSDNVVVQGNAHVQGHAEVLGNSHIKDFAYVDGYARIIDNAIICEVADVHGNARIGKNGYITDVDDYLCIGPIGSRDDFTTFYRTEKDGIYVCCGCFNNSIEKFKKAVLKEHGADSKYGKQYLSAIKFAKSCLEGDEK